MGEALGWVTANDGIEEFEMLRAAADELPGLVFLVQEEKTLKNHLAPGLPRPGRPRHEVARLIGLGAAHVDIGQGESPRSSFADPEGNEFCVLSSRR